ncbi:siderophore-iron reductase FhuF [Pseudomonas sp. PMCC200344]|uniref:siderophore-iron reductase FhuF n=1 Tax=Pseudomonas sp. PMCC200344 TaxID=3042028 RepID=UPI0024B39020|nr:siderophore-iron reductase FhuF [Pseudomonas sp. PMCC200344]
MTSLQTTARMLDETLLDKLFRFDGAFLRSTCRLSSHVEGRGLIEFRDPQTCTDLLRLYAHYYPAAPRAALVSQWSMDLICVTLALPLAAAAQHLRCIVHDPHVALENGMPVAQVFAAGEVLPLNNPLAFAQQLLTEDMAPLVQALASAGRVAQRLLWNNVAAAIDVALDYFQMPHAPQWRDHLFRERHWADGTRNPLYGFLQLAPGPSGVPLLMRKVCCLHHQLGDARPYCDNCPLVPGADITAPHQA